MNGQGDSSKMLASALSKVNHGDNAYQRSGGKEVDIVWWSDWHRTKTKKKNKNDRENRRGKRKSAIPPYLQTLRAQAHTHTQNTQH